MDHRELFPGRFIHFGKNKAARHWFGGTHSCGGAWCPNCELPLMLHLSIDCGDPLLSLSFLPCDRLPLFYCMRCSLCWYDFAYRVLSDNEIEFIEGFHGETNWEDWYPLGHRDVFRRRSLELSPVPTRLQELYDRLNLDEELSREEETEVANYTGNFAPKDVGGYPIVDVINQLGGRSFLCQRLDDSPCPGCRKAGYERDEMYFFASLTTDKKARVVMANDDSIQIVFFLCRQCHTVKVRHSI